MKPQSSVVFFPCRDIAETVKYYTEVIGLDIYKDVGNTVWFDCGYGYIAFVQYDDGRPMSSGACISFNMASEQQVDEVYNTLLERPVIGLRGEPKRHPKFPVYSFFLSDPNGYTLEFQKAAE